MGTDLPSTTPERGAIMRWIRKNVVIRSRLLDNVTGRAICAPVGSLGRRRTGCQPRWTTLSARRQMTLAEPPCAAWSAAPARRRYAAGSSNSVRSRSTLSNLLSLHARLRGNLAEGRACATRFSLVGRIRVAGARGSRSSPPVRCEALTARGERSVSGRWSRSPGGARRL